MWQNNRKTCAGAEGAADLDMSTMLFHHLLDDRQAQPGAARIGGARIRGAVEALEDVRDILFGDADARVRDVDVDSAADQ